MNGSRLFGWIAIDGLQHEAVVVLVLAFAEDVVPQVVGFYLGLPLRVHEVPVLVQSQLLVLPPAYVETPGKPNVVHDSLVGGFGRGEVTLDELLHCTERVHVVLYFFLPVECSQCLRELPRDLPLTVLELETGLVRGIEVDPDHVLAVVEDRGYGRVDRQVLPLLLLVGEGLQQVELTHPILFYPRKMPLSQLLQMVLQPPEPMQLP